jgi:hypothetical protein
MAAKPHGMIASVCIGLAARVRPPTCPDGGPRIGALVTLRTARRCVTNWWRSGWPRSIWHLGERWCD